MYKETFSQRLKFARKKTGLTQKEVELETGISQSKLSHYENGTREPDIETIGTLIDLYEINADWILSTGKKDNEKE